MRKESLRPRSLTVGGARVGAVVLMLALAVGISVGDEQAKLTVLNNTDHYLHVIIDDSPYLYVPPDGAVTHAEEGFSVFVVKVFYAPGQGIHGEVERTFRVSPYEPASSGCGVNERGTWGCTQTPSSGGAQLWELSPDSLAQTAPPPISDR